MLILSYNNITAKKIIEFNNEPYEVLSSHVFRMQMRKPVNQTKLRHLVSGRVIENSFHQNESAKEAEIDNMEAVFLYTNKGKSWFCELGNPKNRFSFPENSVHNQTKWLVQNAPASVLLYKEEPITVKIPIKVDLLVESAPPSIKGDTASGGTKQVVLSSGAVVSTPLFINTGDTMRVNTETGEYVERVSKAPQ